MSRVLAGERCFCPPYTCNPFFYPFIIITDIHCRVSIFLCPFHSIHSSKHFSCYISDGNTCRVTSTARSAYLFSVRSKDHTSECVSADTFLETSVYISDHHILRHFYHSGSFPVLICGYSLLSFHLQKSQCFFSVCKTSKFCTRISGRCFLTLRPAIKQTGFMPFSYCIDFLFCHI